MADLILFRHAKAVGHGEAESDSARGLTERGVNDARAAGRALAQAGLTLGVALVSPAARTVETWRAAAAELASAPKLEIVPALYEADAHEAWRIAVHRAPASGATIIVGHNPTLHDLASLLARRIAPPDEAVQEIVSGVPTAAWAAFRFDGDALDAAAPVLLASWRPSRG